MKKGERHPFKGIPRAQWGAYKEKLINSPTAEAMALVDSQMKASPEEQVKTPEAPPIPVFAEQETEPIQEPVSSVETSSIQDTGSEVPKETKAPKPALFIPPNLFMGNTLKLQLIGRNGDSKDPIPGYVTRWFNDDSNKIAMATASGWEFVNRDEVILNEGLTPLNNDLGSRVREVVGKNADGSPQYAYAMKKLAAIHEAHMQEREEKVNLRIEKELRKGLTDYSKMPENRQYTGGQPGTNLPPIDISTRNYR